MLLLMRRSLNGCCDVLRIREVSGTDESREEGRFVAEMSLYNGILDSKLKNKY